MYRVLGNTKAELKNSVYGKLLKETLSKYKIPSRFGDYYDEDTQNIVAGVFNNKCQWQMHIIPWEEGQGATVIATWVEHRQLYSYSWYIYYK